MKSNYFMGTATGVASRGTFLLIVCEQARNLNDVEQADLPRDPCSICEIDV